MRKPKTPAQLKKDLDAIFSKYIRQLYSNNDMVKCYTCGKVKLIKEMQNGHFIPRHYLATRWDESNCRPQCVGCNMFGNGQILEFEEHLIKDIGEEAVMEMKQKRHQITKIDTSWYLEKIEHYKQALIALQEAS